MAGSQRTPCRSCKLALANRPGLAAPAPRPAPPAYSSPRVNRSVRSLALKKRRCRGSRSTLSVRKCLYTCGTAQQQVPGGDVPPCCTAGEACLWAWGRACQTESLPQVHAGAWATSGPATPSWLGAGPACARGHLAVVHLLLNRPRRDQAVDDHLALLANAPRPLARLLGGKRSKPGAGGESRGCHWLARPRCNDVAATARHGILASAASALHSPESARTVCMCRDTGEHQISGACTPACLHICGGVPVGVVEQHAVGSCQVHSQPAHARGQQEAEHCGVGSGGRGGLEGACLARRGAPGQQRCAARHGQEARSPGWARGCGEGV